MLCGRNSDGMAVEVLGWLPKVLKQLEILWRNDGSEEDFDLLYFPVDSFDSRGKLER